MTKTELINAVAEKANISKKEAAAAVNAFTETVVERLVAGVTVSLIGFGTFSTAKREERKGTNPATKEQITIPASIQPKLKFSGAVKDRINNK